MNIKKLLKIIGPGLLWAGAAVGVSHLVQSTRAGANFGFELVAVLIFANIIKYPFFEFAPRYASSTGNSLIVGYKKLGRWAVILFALLSIATMFTIQAAVTMVTAGLFANIFGLQLNNLIVSAIILGITVLILFFGKFKTLDIFIKFIIVTLAISTIIAVSSALNLGFHPKEEFLNPFDWGKMTHIMFLFAFVGWMPAPIDVAVWHSLWAVAKKKDTGYLPSLKESLLDFKIGYFGTAFLALGFLTLGALLMYGSGEQLSLKAGAFAGQLIKLYTTSIGQWAYPVIALAAFTTMFSTTLTCLDAYPRVLKPSTEFIFPKIKNTKLSSWLSNIWLIILLIGTLLLIGIFTSSMGFMVDLATTISFVIAPVFAILNYKVVTGKQMPDSGKPPRWLRLYALIGIVFLSVFSVAFVVWRFLL